MKFLVLGSLNIDIVYQLPHIVAPGETITSYKRSIHPGGKGANQAAALARAGADTFMAGKIGADGIFLKNILDEFNVNTSMIKIDRENPSGHGLIQLAQNGENSIVLFPGTNRQIGDDEIDRVISNFNPGDIILLQNEINSLEQLYEVSDYLSVHIPATDQTRRSIGYDLIRRMPKGATLVNTARKEVIDEIGLVKALEERPDLKYITDIAADAQSTLQEKFGKRVFATAKKMGAETAEANIKAGLAAASQTVDFLLNGNRKFQVNK